MAEGSIWTRAENRAPTGIRSPGRPAGSESLYRLSYPGPIIIIIIIIILLLLLLYSRIYNIKQYENSLNTIPSTYHQRAQWPSTLAHERVSGDFIILRGVDAH